MSSSYIPVQWQEGILLKPQHFQQQDRAHNRLIHLNTKFLHDHYWGFSELKIDHESLKEGYLALISAQGIFEDGTIFSIPDLNSPPEMLQLSHLKSESSIYLAIIKEGSPARPIAQTQSKYIYKTIQIADCESDILDVSIINTKTNKLHLLDNTVSNDFSYLRIGRLEQSISGERVMLDEQIIPTIINVQCNRFLVSQTQLLVKLIRDKILCKYHVNEANSATTVNELIRLSSLKEAYTSLRHLVSLDRLHPERLYFEMLKISSNLSLSSQVTNDVKYAYKHHNLTECFKLIMDNIKENLNAALHYKVMQIKLYEDQHGLWLSDIIKHEYFGKKFFIVISALDQEPLKAELALRHLKISTPHTIYTLVNKALPGIALHTVKQSMSAINHNENDLVFKLQQEGHHWEAVLSEAKIALHGTQILGRFQPQLWVIE